MNLLKLSTKLQLILMVSTVMVLFSCKKDIPDGDVTTEFRKASDYDASALIEWNDVFLEVERYAAGYRPGPAPRALAYLGHLSI
jgi:hypothetical protein